MDVRAVINDMGCPKRQQWQDWKSVFAVRIVEIASLCMITVKDELVFTSHILSN